MAVVDEFLTKDVISHCWNLGQKLKDGINQLGQEIGVNVSWNGTPVRGAISFNEKSISPTLLHSIFLQECICQGIMFGPGETLISYSHSLTDVEKTLNVVSKSLEKIKTGIQNNNVSKLLEGKEFKAVMTF